MEGLKAGWQQATLPVFASASAFFSGCVPSLLPVGVVGFVTCLRHCARTTSPPPMDTRRSTAWDGPRRTWHTAGKNSKNSISNRLDGARRLIIRATLALRHQTYVPAAAVRADRRIQGCRAAAWVQQAQWDSAACAGARVHLQGKSSLE